MTDEQDQTPSDSDSQSAGEAAGGSETVGLPVEADPSLTRIEERGSPGAAETKQADSPD